jgi:hypothetical protein
MSSGRGLSSSSSPSAISSISSASKSNLSGRIITWFYADEDRKKKYLEARAVAAEILADEMLEIADGELDDDNPLHFGSRYSSITLASIVLESAAFMASMRLTLTSTLDSLPNLVLLFQV